MNPWPHTRRSSMLQSTVWQEISPAVHRRANCGSPRRAVMTLCSTSHRLWFRLFVTSGAESQSPLVDLLRGCLAIKNRGYRNIGALIEAIGLETDNAKLIARKEDRSLSGVNRQC